MIRSPKTKESQVISGNPKERIHQLLEDYKKEYGNVPTCNAESDLVDV